jgi:hypothetical protein
MPRSVRDADGRKRPVPSDRPRRGAAAISVARAQLSPAKQRIAEALAALLVSHYRREHSHAERGHISLA